MREIKFRVWDRDLGMFDSEYCYLHFDLSDLANIDDFKWMQYTGLEDKNGREIYEGDIVTILSNGQFKVVEWEPRYLGYNIRPNRRNARGYEVVGNIYENIIVSGGIGPKQQIIGPKQQITESK